MLSKVLPKLNSGLPLARSISVEDRVSTESHTVSAVSLPTNKTRVDLKGLLPTDIVSLTLRGGTGGQSALNNMISGQPGGSVLFRAMNTLKDLSSYKVKTNYSAKNGLNANSLRGMPYPPNVILEVPVGTVVWNEEGKIMGDLYHHNHGCVGAAGGSGSGKKEGLNFPQHGQNNRVIVEHKTLCTVGLVGFPAVGKTALFEAITGCMKYKRRASPLYTFAPKVLMYSYGGMIDVEICDLPSLVEDAELGFGYGLGFLRHVERAKVILFMVGAGKNNMSGLTNSHTRDSFETTLLTLKAAHQFNPELLNRGCLLILSKVDTVDDQSVLESTYRSLTTPNSSQLEDAIISLGIPDDLASHLRKPQLGFKAIHLYSEGESKMLSPIKESIKAQIRAYQYMRPVYHFRPPQSSFLNNSNCSTDAE